jgi:choline dehydrogenase-like flavoprotein
MVYVRGNRANYDGWAAEGCNGWSFEEVLPFFKKLEDHEDGESAYHGSGGPIRVSRHPVDQLSPSSLAFLQAASEVCSIPICDDFNAETQQCASIYQMSSRHGVRSSTAEGYVHPSLERPNFFLEIRAQAHRVIIENGRAAGVRYRGPRGITEARARREVIVSCGVVGSPHILMLSGIGPADHLREHGIDVQVDLPGVGSNLHDHLFVPLTYRSPTSLHRGTALHFFGGMAREYLLRNGWFGRTVFEAGAFIKSHDGAPVPDIQIHTLPWGYPTPNQDGPQRPDIDKGHCLTVMPTLIYPKSRGSLRLASSDPAKAPLIDPRFLDDPEDVQLLVTAIRKCREICAHPAMADHLAGELTPGAQRSSGEDLVGEIRLRATTVYHPVGTCRMGLDEMAVVDPNLHVRGIEGLRVADASIMPRITGGNTNAPSMMIGERAATLILGAR